MGGNEYAPCCTTISHLRPENSVRGKDRYVTPVRARGRQYIYRPLTMYDVIAIRKLTLPGSRLIEK